VWAVESSAGHQACVALGALGGDEEALLVLVLLW